MNNMIKILILTTTFPRWKGDTTPSFVYELSKRLQNYGLEIYILSPHYNGAKKYEIMEGMKIYRFPYFFPKKYQKLVYDGGILSNLKRSNLAKIQIPLLLLSEFYYTIRLIKKEKIDLIHSHWVIPSGLIGSISKKIFGIKHVTTAHAGDIFTIKNFKALRSIGSFVLRNSDRITANSSYTKDAILSVESKVKDNVEIIPMGVDTYHFNPKWKNSLNLKKFFKTKYLILSVGRLVEKKGIKYLIMAMKYIIEEFSDCKLLIGGSGPEKDNLEKLISELGLSDKVFLTGYIKNSELPSYYASSDVFVLPSIVMREGDTEGLGIVLLEAMACGTPVIGSNVGGIRDIIKNNETGFLTKSKNPEDIADKIIKILSSEQLKQQFSENSLKMIKEYFSWHVVTNMFFKVLKV